MIPKKELEKQEPAMFKELDNFFNSEFFPCLFAKASFNKGFMLFCLFDDINEFKNDLTFELADYIKRTGEAICKKEKSYLTGVFLIKEKPKKFSEFDFLIETINHLRENDSADWPEGKTKNPNAQDFDFYWNQKKLFPVLASPDHPAKIRASPYLMLAIQPGTTFDFNKSNRHEFYQKMRISIHESINRIYQEKKPYYLSEKSSGKNIFQFAGVDPTEKNKDFSILPLQ
ncbi:MAG: YqcI/YcgG family protein [Methyloprofundus sp.]|nr:YqcI/YcgG family protein [Methyloprofundus sp.]